MYNILKINQSIGSNKIVRQMDSNRKKGRDRPNRNKRGVSSIGTIKNEKRRARSFFSGFPIQPEPLTPPTEDVAESNSTSMVACNPVVEILKTENQN